MVMRTGWWFSRDSFLPSCPVVDRNTGSIALLLSGRGSATEPVPVSAYVGSSKNLKDLKDRESRRCSRDTYPESNITEDTLVYEEK